MPAAPALVLAVALALLAALATSCGGSAEVSEAPGAPGAPEAPETLEDCEDAACREALVRARLAEDPAAAAALIDAMEEPVEQLATLSALVDEEPARIALICPHLSARAAVEQCERYALRPHLFTTPGEPSVPQERTAPGPAGRDVLPADATSIYAEVAPAGAGCEEAVDRTRCVGRKAREAAIEGGAIRAAALCRDLENPTWQHECTFQAGEAMVQAVGVPRYDEGVELCLLSGEYASNCLSHLFLALSRDVPDPTRARQEDWAGTLEEARAVAAFWRERAPAFADIEVSRFWTQTLTQAWQRADTVNGVSLPFLPKAARPHFRAGAAMRLVVLEREAERDLAGWRQRLDEALADRVPYVGGEPELEGRRAPLEIVADRWPEDLGQEGRRPAVFYLGTSRRTVGETPEEDRLIVLLEALARVQPPGAEAALREALAHPSDAVSWTARRLLEEREDDAAHRPGSGLGTGP